MPPRGQDTTARSAGPAQQRGRHRDSSRAGHAAARGSTLLRSQGPQLPYSKTPLLLLLLHRFPQLPQPPFPKGAAGRVCCGPPSWAPIAAPPKTNRPARKAADSQTSTPFERSRASTSACVRAHPVRGRDADAPRCPPRTSSAKITYISTRKLEQSLHAPTIFYPLLFL